MKIIISILLIALTFVYTDTPNACDVLAADPEDKSNPPGVEGVKSSEINTEKAIEACIQAVKGFPNESRYSFQLGRAYEQAKDVKNAIKWLEKSAHQKNIDAQYYLALIYSQGEGIEQDLEKAIAVFKQLAEQGYAPAQAVLGHIYREGLGLKQDYNQALIWTQKAADQNHTQAQYDLANMYYSGEGVDKDYKKAFKWFMKAADQNHTGAQYYLGWMYNNGQGVEQDYKKAFRWTMKAAEKGDADAQNSIGDMYYRGKGVDQDYKKAFKWFMKAAEQDTADSQYKIGWMYDKGQWATKNRKKAFKWFMKAAEQDDLRAIEKVADYYYLGYSVKQDFKKAFKWYMKSALKGDSDGQGNIGNAYYQGVGVRKDYKKAFEWYMKAAKQSDAISQATISTMYRDGQGVKKNYIKAYSWMNIALAGNIENEQTRIWARKDLNDLERKMTPQQIAIAQNYDPLNESSKVDGYTNSDKKESAQGLTGTGFFVDKSKVLTNDHVVKECRRIELVRNGYKSGAKITAKDSINDLAILEADTANSSSLSFRAGKGIRTGDDILAVGYPLGYLLGSGIKLTTGNVSALTGLVNDTTRLQLTAPIQPGNSGGPLLDKSGNVVGVIVSRMKEEQNVNMAIKSNVAQMFLDINNIDYDAAMSKDKKEAADIVDVAKESIVQVLCYQ